MGFRQIYIKSGKKLYLKDNNLHLIKKDDEDVYFVINDIDLVFVEDPNIVITARAITYLTKNKKNIIFCDETYLPATNCIGIYNGYKQVENFDLQVNFLQSKKDKLWEFIIKQKIINHINCLYECEIDVEKINIIKLYLSEVKSGDKNFVEGIEARLYFQYLFGKDFIRHEETGINIALDYGYSIIHSAIVRALNAVGLNTMLGIHHSNKENYFNLASDLIEPFRAFVDVFVYKNTKLITIPLSKDFRLGLINLLNQDVIVDNKVYKLEKSIELTIYSFLNYLKSGNINDIKLVGFVNG